MTDLFVEVTNLTRSNKVWAYFTVTGYYLTSIIIYKRESLYGDYLFLFSEDIDWENTVVTGMSGIEIEMPSKA